MNFTKFINNPIMPFIFITNKYHLIEYSDEYYIKNFYKFKMGKKLDLINPKTYNEKLQWLKLFNRKDIYTSMVDKYEAKKYVSNIIGEEYIIPTIGIYKNFNEIDFKKLPNQFVIKCTHDSGGLVIVKDKYKFNIKSARKKINTSMNENFFYYGREWPYKNVKPRIIIEQLIEDNEKLELNDYKFFCFNGKVKIILVCSNRRGKYKNTNFYDRNWNLLPVTRVNHTNNPNLINKPINLDKMIIIAERLSKDIPFIRVDLYEVNKKIYFGELTFFPSSGFEGFNPEEWDIKLGNMLELPIINLEGKNEK